MKKLKMDKLVKAVRKVRNVKSLKKTTKIIAPVVVMENAAPAVVVPVLNDPTTEAKPIVEKKGALMPLGFSQNVTLGGDPEFFFAKDGKIIGSEKVLTADGLKIAAADSRDNYHPADISDNKFVIDGVQAELHPRPGMCRALLGNDIAQCFRNLDKMMKKKGVSADFSQNVEVSQEEMDTLSDKNKVFGCAPSLNAYDGGESKITVDPKVFRGRSAGGHIHIGNAHQIYINNPTYREQYRAAYELSKNPANPWALAWRLEKALKSSDIMVPILDIVVGNTCVLIDRDPSNIERRKVYGKAGEHRIKEYGIEYRTLSNFWLRSYQLMSFVTGLCRFTAHLVEQSTENNDYVKALFDTVKRDDIIRAINNNDFDLALKNFKAIVPIIEVAAGTNSQSYPLTRGYINSFYYFINKGVDHWFEKDVMKHWVAAPDGHGTGWEAFLTGRVFTEFRNSIEKTPFNLKPPVRPTDWKDLKANEQYNKDYREYTKAYTEAMDPKRYDVLIMEVKDPTAKPAPVVAAEVEVMTA